MGIDSMGLILDGGSQVLRLLTDRLGGSIDTDMLILYQVFVSKERNVNMQNKTSLHELTLQDHICDSRP